MTKEAAFLAAIRAAPKDAAVRLVYAAWLAERGDPRATLIRIEEEMRQVPVFSDRFWELKPRRNELRSAAPATWLEVMRYGIDRQPIFRHGVPDGSKERWRLIREYTERWYRMPLPDVGGRLDEIRETERRLGRALPPSVKEWVAFAHDVRRASGQHVVFRDSYQMRELDGLSAISLLLQGEGDYHWAVRHASLSLPDPPVCGFHLDFDNEDEHTFVPDHANPIATTVTEFVLDYAMSCTHAEGGGFATDVADPAKLIGDLKASLPVWTQLGTTQIFEDDSLLIRLDPIPPAPEMRITVEIGAALPREAIPAFLWDYTRNGGAFHGMFIPIES